MPVLVVWWTQADFLLLSNESLGYRYFFAVRLAEHESPAPWQIQGQTIGLAHRLIVALLPEMGLRERLNLFGLASAGVTAAVVILTMIWAARSRWLSVAGVAAVAISAIVPVVGTGLLGWRFRLWPDYYALDLALIPLTVLLFLRLVAGPTSTLGVIGLSAFVGLAAANKVTLLPFAALPLVPVLLRQPHHMVTAAVMAPLAFLGVFVALYDGRPDALYRALWEWQNFLRTSGGSGEATFWSQLLFLAQRWHYDVIGGGCVVAVSVVMARMARRRVCWRSWLTLAAILSVGAFLVYAVVRRPAGTSLYETMAFLCGLACMGLGMVAHDRIVRRVIGGLTAATVLLVVLTTHPSGLYEMMESIHVNAPARWAFRDAVVARGLPTIVVLRDNEFTFSSVEELVLKGYSDQPQWWVRGGQPGLDRTYGVPITFRTDQGGLGINDPYPSGVTLVVVLAHGRPLLEDAPVLAETVRQATCEASQVGTSHTLLLCTTR